MSSEDNSQTSMKAHCNNCGAGRLHSVLHKEVSTWEETIDADLNWVHGRETYYLIKCGGCQAVHLMHHSWFSEEPDDVRPVQYYPPAISRRRPDWLSELTDFIASDWENALGGLLEEIYVALQNDSRQLAAMGTRAALELVMVKKVGDSGAIGRNVDSFLTAGHVPQAFQPLFRDTMMEAGHAAMHRAYVPSKADLGVLLDLTEWLIVSLYIHPRRAAGVKARIPKRKK